MKELKVKCPLCKGINLKSIYQINNIPLFQNKFYKTKIEAKKADIGNINLNHCQDCDFVFNASFSPKKMNYDGEYVSDPSFSKSYRDYVDSVFNEIKSQISIEHTIVEIGCGKGYFVELLKKNGFENVYGFDPAYEGNNKNIIRDFYSYKYSNLNADFIILRHVLEHIDTPYEFLKQIAKANKYRGKIYIEVPNFQWEYENKAFYNIFYEHCDYFTPQTLSQLFKKSIYGKVFRGEFFYILADLKNLQNKLTKPVKINNYANLYKEKLLYYRDAIKDTNSLFWGAGARCTTFLNILDKEKNIKYVYDINPKKQNMYIAKTAHYICGGDIHELIKKEKIDCILIARKNYKDEIIKQVNNKQIRFVVLGEQ